MMFWIFFDAREYITEFSEKPVCRPQRLLVVIGYDAAQITLNARMKLQPHRLRDSFKDCHSSSSVIVFTSPSLISLLR